MAHAFTMECSTLSPQLISHVGVLPSGNTNRTELNTKLNALWDTGATGTVISASLAEKLELIAVSKRKASGVSGDYMANCYYVDIYLPNGILVEKVLAMEGNIPGFDVLIGMNIITLGDFSVSNYQGKTSFTYRIPSMMKFDFVNHSYLRPISKGKKTGVNDPCPCGSGKKYKNCHGK